MAWLQYVASMLLVVGAWSAVPARDAQALFAFSDQAQPAWTGGDSDTSAKLDNSTTVFFFADSFVGRFNPRDHQRDIDGVAMPHSSMAIMRCDDSGSCTSQFRWATDHEDVVPLFRPSTGNLSDFLWPVQALAVSTTSNAPAERILLLADRIHSNGGAFDWVQVATTVITIELSAAWAAVPGESADGLPAGWTYTTCDLPWTGATHGGLAWSTAIFPDGAGDATGQEPALFTDSLWVIGQLQPTAPQLVRNAVRWSRAQANSHAVLMRVSAKDIAQCSLSLFSSATFWYGSARGLGPAPSTGLEPSALGALFSPAIPESAVAFLPKTGYTLLGIPFAGDQVQVWVSSDASSPAAVWELSDAPAMQIPAPWSNSSRYFCYAPKWHLGLDRLLRPSLPSVLADPLWSFVCNTWSGALLFEPGELDTYVPSFWRGVAHN